MLKFCFSAAVFISVFFLSCSYDTVTGTTDTPAKVEDILLSKETLYLAIGQETEISARISPDSAEQIDLIWTVYNPQIASVQNGLIKALSTGKTKVAVTGNDITREINVIVRNLEKNLLRIHFQSQKNTPESYKEFGIFLIGNALPGYDAEGYAYKLSDTLYNFRNFLQFKHIDVFGMYTDISIQDDKNLRAGILKNSKGFDSFSDLPLINKVDLLAFNEIWFVEGVSQFFVAEPIKGLTNLKISGEDIIAKTGEKVTLQLDPIPATVALSKKSWQTSNQYIAEVDSNGTVSAKKPGTVVVSVSAGGIIATKNVCVVPPIKTTSTRIHYKRYNGDYANWSIETPDSSYSFGKFDPYGAYVDIPLKPHLQFSLKTEFDVALNYSGNDSAKNELWILQGRPVVMSSRPVMDIGAVKIANSWSDKSYQNGRNWENVIDGFFYMSYDALKKNNAFAYYLGAKKGYQPRMVAVFNIESIFRGDFRISFGVGDTTNPRKIKYFLGYPYLSYANEYSSEFPGTDLVFDITEFLPLQNENVFMEIKDGASNRTLKVNHFSIEIFDAYSSDPVQTFSDSGLPAFTVDGGVTRFFINNLTVAEKAVLAKHSSESFFVTSRPLSAIDIQTYTPCPSRMPLDHFQNLVNSGRIKIMDRVIPANNNLAKSMTVSRVDNSKSPYFPPIGSQEQKGSCTAWALGYYMATYNIAREHNWDLSGARWVNGSISEGYRDKIMSPDFLYNLINEAVDEGSFGHIASLVLEDIGIASMKTAPVVYDKVKSWPSEAALREAPLYRHNESTFFYCAIRTDEDIENIKKLLRAGELVTVAFQASGIKLSENDTYTQQYAGTSLDHLVTIVGFDDNWTTDSKE